MHNKYYLEILKKFYESRAHYLIYALIFTGKWKAYFIVTFGFRALQFLHYTIYPVNIK